MKINKEGTKKFLIINIFFIFALAYIYRSYIIGNESFKLYADYIGQHIPFYEEFFRLIKSGEIGWSWNTFLGTNFYGSKGYYLVGDVFAYLCYFLNLLFNNTIYSMFIMTLIKLYFGFVGFYFFLRKHNINYLVSGGFALAFVCSGWVGLFVEHPVFLSFYVFMPYMLWGLERIIKDKKPLLFTCSVCLMISANFYLAYSFCFFLLIYWIIRYVELNEKFIFKNFLKESFKILGYFLVGVLLASIIWMPSVYHTLQSPRTKNNGTLASYGFTWTIKQVLRILQNFFVPFIYGNNDTSLYADNWYYFNQIGLYAGILPLICTGIYCLKKNKNRTEKINTIFVIICLLTLISPKIGLIFHLTYSLRYAYMIMLVMLYVGSISLNNIYENSLNNKKDLIIISSICLILIIVLIFVVPYLRNYDITSFVEFKPYLKAIVFLAVYFVVLMFVRNKKVLLVILLVFSTLEVTTQNKTQIRSLVNANVLAQEGYEAYESYTLYELVDYIREYDDGFYRIDCGYGNNRNFSMVYDMPTISTYDSTYEFAIEQFLDLLRLYPDIDWNFYLNNDSYYDLLDVKYVISQSDYYASFGPMIYESSTGWKIFEVNSDNYLLRSYNSFLDFDKLMEMSKDGVNYFLYEVTDQLFESVALDKEYVNDFNQKYKDSEILKLNPDEITNNYVCFNFECESDEFIYLSIPNDEGWTITDNGNKLESISSNGGFIGLEITKGSHKLELTYKVPYLKEGKILSLTGFVICVCLYLWPLIKKHGKVQ